jgi:hypothetical protein
LERRREQTRFLNVDLDIRSRAPLERLARALGPTVFALHVGREGRKHTAHFEVETITADAGALIRHFVSLVRRLPRAERRLWDGAELREFNLGFQAEDTPPTYEWHLDPQAVRAAASVNAGIGITVYSAGRSVTS